MWYSFFWLKKALARMFFPMPLSLFLIFAGLMLTMLCRKGREVPRKRRVAGIICIAAGGMILFTGGYFGTLLLHCYAGDKGPLPVAGLCQNPPAEGYLIAVTSAGYSNGGLNSKTQQRFREGYRLAKELEQRGVKWRLVLSFPGRDRELVDRTINECNRFFDIPGSNVIAIRGAANSRQEIAGFVRYPGRMIIVSSASHLPRLLYLAGLHGVRDPLASAAVTVDYEKSFGNLLVVFPSAAKFADFETLVYEVLGLMESKFTSWFSAPPAAVREASPVPAI